MVKKAKKRDDRLDLADYIAYNLPRDIIAYDVSKGELSLFIDRNNIVKVISFLKDDNICMFNIVSDIFAVDYQDERAVRFEIIYNLLSTTLNQRIKLRVSIEEKDKTIKSISHYLYSATVYEQEVFEGFGIFFLNNKQMTNLYLDKIYNFNPMQKHIKTENIPAIYFDKETNIFRVKT